MEEYLDILNFVIHNSENTSMFSGKDATKKAHPEDLMVNVQATAESIALTLVAIDKLNLNLKKKK